MGKMLSGDMVSFSELWAAFEDVPIDLEFDCIDTDWYIFSKGTPKEDIWHWFEKEFDIKVADYVN